MKKLMMALAVVLTASFASASVYNWTFGSNEESTYGNYKYYAINGDASTLISTLTVDGDIAAFNTAIAGMGANVQSGTVVYEEGYAELSGGFNPAANKFTLLLVEELAAGKDIYYASVADTSAYQFEPGGKGKDPMLFGDDYGSSVAAPFTAGSIADVPEPTSGMLLLLGMAGLALRRRRA